MNKFYVLDADQKEAQRLYEVIVASRKSIVKLNIDALHFSLEGEYLKVRESDRKVENIKSLMDRAYHELDQLQAKRVHRERFEKVIKELGANGNISIVRVERGQVQ